ncbi:hypothetical protein F183_A55210 (plasmid) [Bryobacterales bacterium F-183]|nr:hypothetical protein F183_A55210 [Bryobacterales bacterium F-183]
MTPYQTTRINNDLVIHVLRGTVWLEVLRVALTDRQWGVIMHAPEANMPAVLKEVGVTVPKIEFLTSGPAVEPRLAMLGGPISPTYAELEALIYD